MRAHAAAALTVLLVAAGGLAGCATPPSGYPEAYLATGHELPADLRPAQEGDPAYAIFLQGAGMEENPGKADPASFQVGNGSRPEELHIALLVRDRNASVSSVSMAARYADAADVDRLFAEAQEGDICPPDPQRGVVLRDGAVLAMVGTSSDDATMLAAVQTVAARIADATGATDACA